MGVCHDFCHAFPTRKYEGRSVNKLLTRGYKICRTCDIMIFVDKIFCPCCGYKLSMKCSRSTANNRQVVRI